jgi:hypothetical protein
VQGRFLQSNVPGNLQSCWLWLPTQKSVHNKMLKKIAEQINCAEAVVA